MFHNVSELQIVDTIKYPETSTSTGFAVGWGQFNRTLLIFSTEVLILPGTIHAKDQAY